MYDFYISWIRFIMYWCCCPWLYRKKGYKKQHNKFNKNIDPLENFKQSELSVRRISRVYSDDESGGEDFEPTSKKNPLDVPENYKKTQFLHSGSNSPKWAKLKRKKKADVYSSLHSLYSAQMALSVPDNDADYKTFTKSAPKISAPNTIPYDKRRVTASPASSEDSKWNTAATILLRNRKDDRISKSKHLSVSEICFMNSFERRNRLDVPTISVSPSIDVSNDFLLCDPAITRCAKQYRSADDVSRKTHSREESVESSRGDLDSDSDMGSSNADTGEIENPIRECYGSITLSTRALSKKSFSVSIKSLQGLPCRKIADQCFILEFVVLPKGKSLLYPLPKTVGSKIIVNSDVILHALPSVFSTVKSDNAFIKMTVWMNGQMWKHCSYGSCVIPVTDDIRMSNIPVYRYPDMGMSPGNLEIGLLCGSLDKDLSNKETTSVQVEIFRARLFPEHIFRNSKNDFHHKREIWCRVSLWHKGKKIKRVTSPKVMIPVNFEPTFNFSTTFQIHRSTLSFSCVVVKVLCFKERGMNEMVVGKIVLGPHFYLGISKGEIPHGELSHWGRSVTHSEHIFLWHKLYHENG